METTLVQRFSYYLFIYLFIFYHKKKKKKKKTGLTHSKLLVYLKAGIYVGIVSVDHLIKRILLSLTQN